MFRKYETIRDYNNIKLSTIQYQIENDTGKLLIRREDPEPEE